MDCNRGALLIQYLQILKFRLENKVRAASVIEPTGYIPLTLAVPTYNRCSSVQALVKAIQAQAKEQDEIILSDDGSTDGTFEEASKIPGIRLVRHKENQGMVQNWNYCLEQARCDWICIIHDDDTLAPGGVEVLRRACEFADQPALILPTETQAECDDSFRYRFWSPGAWSVLHCPSIPSGAVIHREIIQELGVFNPKFCYSADLEYFQESRLTFPWSLSKVLWQYVMNCTIRITRSRPGKRRTSIPQLEEIQRSIISYAGIKGAGCRIIGATTPNQSFGVYRSRSPSPGRSNTCSSICATIGEANPNG